MHFTKYKIKTRELRCDILDSLFIVCATGATLNQIEADLKEKLSKSLVKYYLFYLVEIGCISYGKVNHKYITERKGYDMINDIHHICTKKDKRLENLSITFELETYGGLNKFR